MSYLISWYKPEHILFMKTPRAVTEEDIRTIDTQAHEYMTQAQSKRVHVIIDDTEMESMPGLLVTQTLQTLRHPKMGWTVVVGQKNKVFRMMYTITCHLMRLPVYLADNIEEAIAFLQRTEENPLSK